MELERHLYAVQCYKSKFFEGLSGGLLRRAYKLDTDNRKLVKENRTLKLALTFVSLIVIARALYDIGSIKGI